MRTFQQDEYSVSSNRTLYSRQHCLQTVRRIGRNLNDHFPCAFEWGKEEKLEQSSQYESCV